MTLFDAFLIVDWSAASHSKLGKDSIWASAVRTDPATTPWLENLPTRTAATAAIRAMLSELVEQEQRILVGFDFPYGYPSGFAEASDELHALPWEQTWKEISDLVCDDDANQNNRFHVASELNAKRSDGSGPFWGCPASRASSHLHPTSCGFPWRARDGRTLARLRCTDKRARGVQEAWKLFGAGSVGSQALVGIPRLRALRAAPELAAWSRVWPFETHFTPQPAPPRGPFVLHAVIWPGVVPIEAHRHPVRDAAQVLTLAHHFAALDRRGELGRLFEAPEGLAEPERAACIAEEGWILGA